MARRVPIGRVAERALSGNSTGLLPAMASSGPVVASAARRGGGTPGAKKLPKSVYDAINAAATPAFGRWAKKNYGVGGKRLLALVAAGEGGGSIDEGTSNTSSAGARGPFQFIASTRDAYIKQYGIDPWKSDRAAARAAMIHLRGTGVAGYNPGMPSYASYILGQSVDTRPLVTGGYGGRSGTVRRVGGGSPGRAPSLERDAVEPQAGASALLRALMEADKPAPVGGSPLAPPAFSAAPALPGGYQGVASGGGPAPPKPDVSELMALVEPGAGLPGSRVIPGEAGSSGGGGGGGSSSGKLSGIDIAPDGNHGAMQLAKYATQGIYGSGERTPAENAAAGGSPTSDHLTTNRFASAVDAKYGTGRLIARRLGIRGWKKGTYDRHEIVVDGRRYSVQILEDVEGHFDHTHVGIQRVR